jgi:hypothetical protein
MFRIKTDIRQYKCESREKVERLIRNWVVRPTDLIFYDDEQEWGPIGEHAAFISTFAELAQREENAPDTIVTSETNGEEEGRGAGRASSPEANGGDSAEMEPPEPPEGFEQAEAEPDEITVMTEETLDSILEEGESGEGGGEIAVVQTGSGAELERAEVTQPEATRPAPVEETTQVEVEEPTRITDREEVGQDDEVTEPAADSVDGLELEDEDETTETEEELSVDGELRDTDEIDDEVDGERTWSGEHGPIETGGGQGRHDLPEEIFATNEIESSARDEEAEPSSGEYEAADFSDSEPVDYTEVEEALQENARQAKRQKHVDDEWDEILQRLRETDELSKEEIDEITETRDQIAIGRDEGEDGEEEEVPEEIEEYVSEGYEKELLIDIGPSGRDMQLGIHRSRASTDQKDRVFPYPGPKQEDQVVRRVFTLEEPDQTDHSVKVIIGLVGIVLFLIFSAVAIL